MKKVNYGLAKCDYTHWIIIGTFPYGTKLMDNQIKTGLEHLFKICISKCKDVTLKNGERGVVLDVVNESNYNFFVDLFKKQQMFYMQKSQVYINGEGIADDTKRVEELVYKLKGKLVATSGFSHNSDLIVSRGHDDHYSFYNQQQKYFEPRDEFTELYETLKSTSSNYESNLKKEVDSLLISMFPNINSHHHHDTTEMTCLKTGIIRKF